MDPSRIMQVGMGFWAAKTLLSAVELGVFTKLGAGPMTGAELGKSLGLAPRGWYDFFDTLVALGFLDREGQGPTGRYRNGDEAAVFLDRNRPSYMGGFLEMCSARLYRFWGDLTDGLRTGAPQNELKRGGKSMFEELCRDPRGSSSSCRRWPGSPRAPLSVCHSPSACSSSSPAGRSRYPADDDLCSSQVTHGIRMNVRGRCDRRLITACCEREQASDYERAT